MHVPTADIGLGSVDYKCMCRWISKSEHKVGTWRAGCSVFDTRWWQRLQFKIVRGGELQLQSVYGLDVGYPNEIVTTLNRNGLGEF